MTSLVRQASQACAMRYCLTCRRESERAKFKGQKCGPCVAKWGLPVGYKPKAAK